MNSEKHQFNQEKSEEEIQNVAVQNQEEEIDEQEEQRKIDEETDIEYKTELQIMAFLRKNNHKFKMLNKDHIENFVKENPNYICLKGPVRGTLCYPKSWPVVIHNNKLIDKKIRFTADHDDWRSLITFKKWPNQNEPISIEAFTCLVDYPQLYIYQQSKQNEVVNSDNIVLWGDLVLIQENGQIIVRNFEWEMFTKVILWEINPEGILVEIKQDYHQVLLNSFATLDFDLYQYQVGNKIIAKIKKGERVTVLLNFTRSSINEYGTKIDVYDFLVANEFGIVGWIRDVERDSCRYDHSSSTKIIYGLCMDGS